MTNKEAVNVLFNEWKCIDRNDGIHCDRKCESCDLVMDVGIIRDAFNMAISALQEQDSPKPIAESVQNVQNEDLISRKAAIDAVSQALKRTFIEYEDIARTIIGKLPSVEPEPLSDAYTKAVWTWLLDYQIKVAKLKGRYTPYEVLSWVANDWRKEHE